MVYETELKSTGSVTQKWVSLKKISKKKKNLKFFELSPNPRNLPEMRHMVSSGPRRAALSIVAFSSAGGSFQLIGKEADF